ncbi:unnamed protein product [Rotaria sp. Silwood2]|nr:unnamed protein product [Rotaria sp. Silwood2]CAF3206444.1 unnamed protein product [Rotaria sp. Silwood2]CAF4043674.1 unnamed protein product [Rotaria sp. Silwood2]CAF4145190.1 unnamed protein product [Rotaria sp. Silwood2]
MQSYPPYSITKRDDKSIKYHASCYCSLVQYVFYDKFPFDSTYCHCYRYSLKFYNNSENIPKHTLPNRVSCKQCSTSLDDEGRRMWLAFSQIFKEFRAAETI